MGATHATRTAAAATTEFEEVLPKFRA